MKGRPREQGSINGRIRAVVKALPPGEIVTYDDLALKIGQEVSRKSLERAISHLRLNGEVQTMYVVMKT